MFSVDPYINIIFLRTMVNRLFFSPRNPKYILTEPQKPKTFFFSNRFKGNAVRNQAFNYSCNPAVYNRTFFRKMITFLVRKFQKFCVWFFTLYAFIISKVSIRTQNDTNASLISASACFENGGNKKEILNNTEKLH